MRTIPMGTMMKDEQDRHVRNANRRAKKQQKQNDERIQRLYGERCSGVQISVMDIGKVFKVGQQAIAEGADDQTVGDRIAAYVETIRSN